MTRGTPSSPWSTSSAFAIPRTSSACACSRRLVLFGVNRARHRLRHSAKFLGEPYEKTFGPANVAEPIRVFVLDHFVADELGAVLTEPAERLVDVVHGEHDA